ncbi:MAG: tetratricopeptide repeat protein [Candidatus Sulfotelmatobacter sp.]
MKPIERVLFTVVLAGAQLWAQANPQEPLHEAYVFERQGQFNKAVVIAKGLADSGRVSGAELGRAWNVLGVVYTQQGKLLEAQNAFERSLQVFGQEPQFVADYAAALQNYGELYNDSGERAIAGKMWRKALDLLQQSGDHAGIARSLTYLAGLALAQNRIPDAKKYLRSVAEEMKLAHDLSDDDLAFIYETQAWLARAEGHLSAAVAGYQRSLELCKRIYGERHWKTGWDYMLRGKAYALCGDIEKALVDMRNGLGIMEQALGRKNPRYFAAQIAYAAVLDQAGLREQAAQLRAAVEQAQKDFNRSQCVGCTINVAAFR